MSGPRIIRTIEVPLSELGSAAVDNEELAQYTGSGMSLPDAPFVAPRHRIDPAKGSAREVTIATLAAAIITLVLSLFIALRPVTNVPDRPQSTNVAVLRDLQASGRGGPDRISCLSDSVTVSVTADDASSGVAAGWIESSSASLPVVLYPDAGGFSTQLVVEDGVLRAAGSAGERLAVFPGERLVLRIQGVALARALIVTGGPGARGARGDDTCA